MKLTIVIVCLCLSACATRHVPDTSAWFVDCYNKQRQEAMIAQAESQLSADDANGRRRLRKMFWDLQKECR
jgi:hypothetical protein